MRKLRNVSLGALLVTLSYGAGWASGLQSGLSATPTGEVRWNELPDGRATAAVHGDMRAGEHLTFVRFPSGLTTAPHTHSETYVGIVVKGSARHFEPGSSETAPILAAGSHYRVPGGTVHISECLEDSECVFAIHQHGAFDRTVVE